MAYGKKDRFLAKLNSLCREKNYNNVFLSCDERENIIKILMKEQIADNSKYYRLKKRFEVINVGGTLRLIKLRKSSEDSILFVSCNEELYEILLQAHISTGHGGRDRMIKEVNLKYAFITRETISIFLSLCEHCKVKKSLTSKKIVVKSIHSNKFMSRCQVDFIDYQSQPDGDYKFVLVFQDHFTKFVQLRPLKSNTATEVAWELYNIFCIFGVPSILHTDSGREFENEVSKQLLSYWPECNLVYGKPRHSQSQCSVETSNQDIENILITAMADHKTNNWTKLLPFVQISKNTAFHAGMRRSPYESLFGSPLKVGINGLPIPKDMINKIKTEEELDKFYLDTDTESQNIIRNINKNWVETQNGTQSNEMIDNLDSQNVAIDTESNDIDTKNIIQVQAIEDNRVEENPCEILNESNKEEKNKNAVKEETVVYNENNNDTTTKEALFNPIVVASEAIFTECADISMDSAINIKIEDSDLMDFDGNYSYRKFCIVCGANTKTLTFCESCRNLVHESGCSQNNTNTNASICFDCVRKTGIDNARNQTKICPDLQANKTIRYSAKRLKGCSVGDNVIPNPSVDQKRTDRRNVLDVVLNEESGFSKLETKTGIVTQCFTRNEFDPVKENFMMAAVVPEPETSLPIAIPITSTTGGQGMMKCSSTKKWVNKS